MCWTCDWLCSGHARPKSGLNAPPDAVYTSDSNLSLYCSYLARRCVAPCVQTVRGARKPKTDSKATSAVTRVLLANDGLDDGCRAFHCPAPCLRLHTHAPRHLHKVRMQFKPQQLEKSIYGPCAPQKDTTTDARPASALQGIALCRRYVHWGIMGAACVCGIHCYTAAAHICQIEDAHASGRLSMCACYTV